MGLRKQYAIDDPILFVSAFDDAWDHERIDYEDELLEEGGDSHPYSIYQGGHTRFDFEAVRGWLKPDATPVVFSLRRLTLDEYSRTQALKRAVGAEVAWAAAWRVGLEGVTGLDVKLSSGLKEGLSEKDKDKIEAYIGSRICIDVGRAVDFASKPLTEDEKKSSDTTLGDTSRTLETLIEAARQSTAKSTATEKATGTTAPEPD